MGNRKEEKGLLLDAALAGAVITDHHFERVIEVSKAQRQGYWHSLDKVGHMALRFLDEFRDIDWEGFFEGDVFLPEKEDADWDTCGAWDEIVALWAHLEIEKEEKRLGISQ